MFAQGISLNGYAAYVFDDQFDTYYTSNQYLEGKIKGGLMWGVGLEFRIREDYGAELLYFRQDTEAPIRYEFQVGQNNKVIDLGVNYIMLGGVRYFTVMSDKVEPYGGLMLGMAIYENKSPDPDDPSSATKFAWGLRLGTNIWVSDKVGIKLQTYLVSAVQGAGGGFYLGTGGAGAGVSTYSSLYQFGLGGGLVLRRRE
jgi:hypothetical protein